MKKPPAIELWYKSDQTANTRGVLSLLIALHLIVVGTALACSVHRSSLQTALSKIFAPYTRSLFFVPSDTPYAYVADNSRFGSRIDDDHYIEIVDQDQVLEFPLPGSNWSPDRRRWFRLTHQLGWYAEEQQDEPCAVIAKEIAWHYMQQTRADDVLVRCKRRMAQPLDPRDIPPDLPPGEPMSPKYESMVYAAQVYLVDGELQVAKKSATREVAPRTGAPAGAGAGTGTETGGK